jgi:hypothetical protein
MIVLTFGSSQLRADTGSCGGAMVTLPFTDVPATNTFFCSIAEAYFSALTNGTSATTYSPADAVTREQMAAFITRTLDQSLRRGSRRAALNQFWTTQGADNLGFTGVGSSANLAKSDGVDIWVANSVDSKVVRVRASDGSLQGMYTGATSAFGVLCAKSRVFVTGATTPGRLYQVDETSQISGSVITISTSLGGVPEGIAFDGLRIWTANSSGSVSLIPGSPTNVSTGFTSPHGIIYDGANMWITDDISGSVDKLRKLDSTRAILQSVDVGSSPRYPAFDGANIWVPNRGSNSVTVVRASTGVVLATLTGNGLSAPTAAAFDGERILITNTSNSSVSLWKATDLTPIGTFSTGATTFPLGACSDGLNFWITLNPFGGVGQLARF